MSVRLYALVGNGKILKSISLCFVLGSIFKLCTQVRGERMPRQKCSFYVSVIYFSYYRAYYKGRGVKVLAYLIIHTILMALCNLVTVSIIVIDF